MPAATMAQHHYSFPVVTGIDPRDPLAARKTRMAVYERLLAELDANNQHLSQQISEIDLTDPQDARVLMPEQGTDILAHFGDDRFLERYQRYKAHIAEWRQQYPKLAAVDLRYDSQVVLEMTPGTNAVPPPSEPLTHLVHRTDPLRFHPPSLQRALPNLLPPRRITRAKTPSPRAPSKDPVSKPAVSKETATTHSKSPRSA